MFTKTQSATFIATLALTSSLMMAAPILSVDFGTTASTLETDGPFVEQTNTNTEHNLGGGDTLRIQFTSGGVFTRGLIADSGAFNYGDLYRDWYFDNNDSTTLEITGTVIFPSTTYSIRFWNYDTDTDTGMNRKTDYTGTVGTTGSGSIVWTAGAALTDNLQFSDTFDFTSDGTGKISIFIEDFVTSGPGTIAVRLPGLEISTAPVPTPAALPAGLALIGLVAARRRRRR